MRQYTMFNGAKSMQMLTQQRKRVDPSAKPRDVWWANNDYELANLTWFGLQLCPVCFLYIHSIAAHTTARTWVQAALRGEDGSRKAASKRPSQKRSNTMEFLDDILATMTEIGPTDGYKKVLGRDQGRVPQNHGNILPDALVAAAAATAPLKPAPSVSATLAAPRAPPPAQPQTMIEVSFLCLIIFCRFHHDSVCLHNGKGCPVEDEIVGRILAAQEKNDEVEAKKIIREWKDHWQLIRTSKLYFYLKCVLAQEKFGVISLNIDGMDKAKTTVPNIGKSSGAGVVWKVTGVRLHSSVSKDRLFYSSMFAGDTNLKLECLCRALNDQLIENRKKIDHQGQKGTGAEEKSTRANDVQFAGPDLDDRRHEGSKDDFLPEVGGLETFEVGFMQVAHTHLDVDQLFAQLASILGRKKAQCLRDLVDAGLSIKAKVEIVDYVLDYKSWLGNLRSKVSGKMVKRWIPNGYHGEESSFFSAPMHALEYPKLVTPQRPDLTQLGSIAETHRQLLGASETAKAAMKAFVTSRTAVGADRSKWKMSESEPVGEPEIQKIASPEQARDIEEEEVVDLTANSQ
eukprot:g80582.t1